MVNEAAVARAKTRLTAGREEILARHRAGAGGQEVVRAISALTDEVIGELFAAIAAEFRGAGPVPLSLVATGGGRRPAPGPRGHIAPPALLSPGEEKEARA